MQVLTALGEAQIGRLLAQDDFFWLDLTQPAGPDLDSLSRLLNLGDLAVDDMREFNHTRALLHPYGDYMLLVYFAARHRPEVGAEASDMLIEVHLLVSGNYVVTIHNEVCDALVELRDRFARDDRGTEEFVVYNILDMLTDTFFPVLDEIEDEIDALEDEVIVSASDEHLRKSRHVKRESFSSGRRSTRSATSSGGSPTRSRRCPAWTRTNGITSGIRTTTSFASPSWSTTTASCSPAYGTSTYRLSRTG